MANETVGEGKYQYQLIEDWAKPRPGETFGLVSSGACDSQDRVFLCQRKNPPIQICDPDSGEVVESWGDGRLTHPHGFSITDDTLYIADEWNYAGQVYTLKGEHILTLGTPGVPSDTGYTKDWPTNKKPVPSSGGPFNRPTKLVKGDDGDLYMSDGYGNARIHRFSADGELKKSWGAPGAHVGVKEGGGEFFIVHSVLVHEGRVYVADRQNEKVQIFTTDGDYIDSWLVPRPMDVVVDNTGTFYVSGRVGTEDISWIWVMDKNGTPLAKLVSRGGHGIWVDSKGSIYAGLSRHSEAAIPDEEKAKDPNYKPPTSFGGEGIVGAVDKFQRV